jgi:uncharacterized membrane protein
MQGNKVQLTPFYLIAATLIGLGDTLFLSYYAYLNIIPSCAIGGCEIVLSSVYSHPFGVPFAYIGLLYYLHMLGIAVLLAIDPQSKGLRLGALLYSGIGLLLSMGFEFFQFFVIGALCLYCGISAATTLALFLIALWHFRDTHQ